jgi:hypothetical protein
MGGVGRRAATGDQLTLGVELPRLRPGRVERRVATANRRRRREGSLTAADDALVALAVELARQVDVCARTAQPYALAQVGRVLVDAESELARRAGGGTDAFAAFLAAVDTPAGSHPAAP